MTTSSRFGYKSLPSYYKGIKFRSRLEARRAIILDQLGIDWEYEPEPIWVEVYEGHGFSYLPDFYLKGSDSFFEVKGNLEVSELRKVLMAAHQITTPHGGPTFESGGRPFLIAGNLGDYRRSGIPISIYNYKGSLFIDNDFETIQHLLFKRHEKNRTYCRDCINTSLTIGNDSDWELCPSSQIPPEEMCYKICNNLKSVYALEEELPWDILPIYWEEAVQKGRTARFDNGVYRGN
jgi:hypothetical protein